MPPKLMTRTVLGRELKEDPRSVAKKCKPVATLVLGKREVPLYEAPKRLKTPNPLNPYYIHQL
jgi:hypothetical protein